MKTAYLLHFLLFMLVACGSHAQSPTKKWQGQAPIKKVSTQTRPIQYQLKKTFDVGNGIYCSNNFDAARLNGVALTDDKEVSVLITPENTPINESPWYAFKIWSEQAQTIQLKISYNQGITHRYYPKISYNGKDWTPVNSNLVLTDTASINAGKKPTYCTISLALDTDTTWIAAQEIISSKQINSWAKELSEQTAAKFTNIGQSREGRPLNLLQLGNSTRTKSIIVLSGQHPPEVTGWLAMKAFVERICANDELAKQFRDSYNILVIPCVNPDGIDHGHWRHNTGGVDLNRDWEMFLQDETQAVHRFMEAHQNAGNKFIFAIDFHSTFQDIYYTISPKLKGNYPGLVPKVIQAMGEDIPGYSPNIKPSGIDAARVSSTQSIFHEFGAEAVTYEVGDNTPRDIIQTKGELTAKNLMKILLSK